MNAYRDTGAIPPKLAPATALSSTTIEYTDTTFSTTKLIEKGHRHANSRITSCMLLYTIGQTKTAAGVTLSGSGSANE
jgi:hypothetical protein